MHDNNLRPVRRRVQGRTLCQSEQCNDMTCKADHIGGVSIFSLGPLPRHMLTVDTDSTGLSSDLTIMCWWYGGGDMPEGEADLIFDTTWN